MLLAYPQAARTLTDRDYLILAQEALQDAKRAFSESMGSAYTGKGTHLREVLNRLILPKWGPQVTELLMPKLYKYYKKHILKPCQKALASPEPSPLVDDPSCLPQPGGDECGSSHAAHYPVKAIMGGRLSTHATLLPTLPGDSSALVSHGTHGTDHQLPTILLTHFTDFWGRRIFLVEALDADRVLGTVKLLHDPRPCLLPDDRAAHNIIQVTGVFAPGGAQAAALQEATQRYVCEPLLPTMREKLFASALEGVQHGACRGLSEVAEYYLLRQGCSETRSSLSGQMVYFMCFAIWRYHTHSTAASTALSALLQTLSELLPIVIITLASTAFCFFLQYIAQCTANKGGKLSSQLLDCVSKWITPVSCYLYMGWTNGIKLTTANLLPALFTTKAIKVSGAAVVNRYTQPPPTPSSPAP